MHGQQGGLGLAVRCELDAFGDGRRAIVIADGFDRMEDVVRCDCRTLSKSVDWVFRLTRGSKVVDYPLSS